MNLPETNIQSFIIKIWLEQNTDEAGAVIWRGYITHVPGGERRYLMDLDDIGIFIAPYLERLGVKLSWDWRARRWLRQSRGR